MRSNDEIIDILSNARRKIGMSRNELADIAGVSSSTQSRYENKQRTFPLELIEKYSRILSLDPGYVFGYVDGNSSNIDKSLISVQKVKDISDIQNGDCILYQIADDPSMRFFYLNLKENIITLSCDSLSTSNQLITYRYENFDINKVIGKVIINS